MPQVIFASRAKGLPFPTFLMDFDTKDKELFTWKTIFNTIQKKYGINIKVLKLFDNTGRRIFYKDIQYIKKFCIDDFTLFHTNGNRSGDFWINFDIYPKMGERLY